MDTAQLIDQAKEITNTARGLADRTRRNVRDAGAAADLYLHEYAWTTLVVVAVAACTVGYLMARRD